MDYESSNLVEHSTICAVPQAHLLYNAIHIVSGKKKQDKSQTNYLVFSSHTMQMVQKFEKIIGSKYVD